MVAKKKTTKKSTTKKKGRKLSEKTKNKISLTLDRKKKAKTVRKPGQPRSRGDLKGKRV